MQNLKFYQSAPAPTGNLLPLDDDLARDPDAADVVRAVLKDVQTLSGAFDTLSTGTEALANQITAIQADTTRTEGYKKQAEIDARNASMEQIEQLRRTCETAKAHAQSVTAPLINSNGVITGTNDAASLAIMQRVRDSWELKVKVILDALTDAGQLLPRLTALATRAAEDGDQYTQSGIRQFAPAYLESRGQLVPRDIFIGSMNRAMASAASPKMRAAMQIDSVLDDGWKRLQGAFTQALKYAKQNGWMRVEGLPGWPGMPPVTI